MHQQLHIQTDFCNAGHRTEHTDQGHSSSVLKYHDTATRSLQNFRFAYTKSISHNEIKYPIPPCPRPLPRECLQNHGTTRATGSDRRERSNRTTITTRRSLPRLFTWRPSKLQGYWRTSTRKLNQG